MLDQTRFTINFNADKGFIHGSLVALPLFSFAWIQGPSCDQWVLVITFSRILRLPLKHVSVESRPFCQWLPFRIFFLSKSAHFSSCADLCPSCLNILVLFRCPSYEYYRKPNWGSFQQPSAAWFSYDDSRIFLNNGLTLTVSSEQNLDLQVSGCWSYQVYHQRLIQVHVSLFSLLILFL